jgi:hypothetical protein
VFEILDNGSAFSDIVKDGLIVMKCKLVTEI